MLRSIGQSYEAILFVKRCFVHAPDRPIFCFVHPAADALATGDLHGLVREPIGLGENDLPFPIRRQG